MSKYSLIYSCQYFIFKYPWVPACQGVITFFVLANFTLATFMDPGVIPKGMLDCCAVFISLLYLDAQCEERKPILDRKLDFNRRCPMGCSFLRVLLILVNPAVLTNFELCDHAIS